MREVDLGQQQEKQAFHAHKQNQLKRVMGLRPEAGYKSEWTNLEPITVNSVVTSQPVLRSYEFDRDKAVDVKYLQRLRDISISVITGELGELERNTQEDQHERT